MYKKKCSVADEIRDKFIIDMMRSQMKDMFKKYDQYIKQYIESEVQRRVSEALQKHKQISISE